MKEDVNLDIKTLLMIFKHHWYVYLLVFIMTYGGSNPHNIYWGITATFFAFLIDFGSFILYKKFKK